MEQLEIMELLFLDFFPFYPALLNYSKSFLIYLPHLPFFSRLITSKFKQIQHSSAHNAALSAPIFHLAGKPHLYTDGKVVHDFYPKVTSLISYSTTLLLSVPSSQVAPVILQTFLQHPHQIFPLLGYLFQISVWLILSLSSSFCWNLTFLMHSMLAIQLKFATGITIGFLSPSQSVPFFPHHSVCPYSSLN